ncbi:MAG: hypothetical protein A2017_11620 [Lentisphaerae bacterium GWF2_44_16]|nr:MAG: hypothetical protein A2017_11620 [Lentisphaerae bacterium GWF2_44_16]
MKKLLQKNRQKNNGNNKSIQNNLIISPANNFIQPDDYSENYNRYCAPLVERAKNASLTANVGL